MILVCDAPPQSENIEYYTIAGIPGDPRAEYDTSGQYGFRYDLSGVPAGEYSIRCSACNSQQCSLPSPLEFTALGRPGQPTGLAILSD